MSITALGDSITRGYGLADMNSERFTSLVADEIEKNGMKPKIANYGVDGIQSGGLLEELEAGYYTAVKATEYVTLCIGANNILSASFDFLEDAATLEGEELKQSYRTLRKRADKGCEQLSKDLPVILDTIREYNPEGKIILLNLYHPYAHFDISMDSIEEGMTLSSLTDEYIRKLNAITESYADEVTAVVDVYAAFDGRSDELVCAYSENGEMTNMDPHPNAAGHEVIAEALWDVLEDLEK
jgi:lysophospholipase L1-like esterase